MCVCSECLKCFVEETKEKSLIYRNEMAPNGQCRWEGWWESGGEIGAFYNLKPKWEYWDLINKNKINNLDDNLRLRRGERIS